MVKSRFTLTALAMISITLTFHPGCQREDSSDVNQDKIYADYELYYNGNEDVTYARALFRFSNELGTKLKLASGSEVRFNGDLLTFKPALAYYEKSYAGKVLQGDFVWEDTNNKLFTNTISLTEIDFPVNLDTILRTAAYELFWSGDSLSAGHAVTLTANGPNELDVQVFHQNDLHSSSIILTTNKLQAIGRGKGELWMDRTFKPDLSQQTSVGGTITGRYRPVNRVVWFE
jgi:hypothetical protein